MPNYRYDIIDAMEHGVTDSPCNVIDGLGFEVTKFEGVPVYDLIWFRARNEVKDLPPYIRPLGNDFLFSDERKTERG